MPIGDRRVVLVHKTVMPSPRIWPISWAIDDFVGDRHGGCRAGMMYDEECEVGPIRLDSPQPVGLSVIRPTAGSRTSRFATLAVSSTIPSIVILCASRA